MNKREIGNEYENFACKALEEEGLTIIERNYRVKIGEIDIIALDNDTLVFAEVKYRKDKSCGGADFAIDYRKQAKIRKVAQWYMASHHISQQKLCRFDAVLINGEELTHIKNAW